MKFGDSFHELEKSGSSMSENPDRLNCFAVCYNPKEFKLWARETLDFEKLLNICPFPEGCRDRLDYFFRWLESQSDLMILFWKHVILDEFYRDGCSALFDETFEHWALGDPEITELFFDSPNFKGACAERKKYASEWVFWETLGCEAFSDFVFGDILVYMKKMTPALYRFKQTRMFQDDLNYYAKRASEITLESLSSRASGEWR